MSRCQVDAWVVFLKINGKKDASSFRSKADISRNRHITCSDSAFPLLGTPNCRHINRNNKAEIVLLRANI